MVLFVSLSQVVTPVFIMVLFVSLSQVVTPVFIMGLIVSLSQAVTPVFIMSPLCHGASKKSGLYKIHLSHIKSTEHICKLCQSYM